MPPESEHSPETAIPADLAPEASEAMDQLRDGIARARVIVREAQQAIGQAPPEGALLPSAPDPDPERGSLNPPGLTP